MKLKKLKIKRSKNITDSTNNLRYYYRGEWITIEPTNNLTKDLLFMCNNYFIRQKRLRDLMNENISLNIRIKTMELLKKSFIKRLIFLFTRRFY